MQVKDSTDLTNAKGTTQQHVFSIHCSEVNFTILFSTCQISCKYSQLVTSSFVQEITIGLIFEKAGERKNRSLPQN